jgi:hypothetical protein
LKSLLVVVVGIHSEFIADYVNADMSRKVIPYMYDMATIICGCGAMAQNKVTSVIIDITTFLGCQTLCNAYVTHTVFDRLAQWAPT